MPWHLSGTMYNPCSCKIGCPCALGEMEADQGWCSAIIVWDIQSGDIDGVSLNGTRVAMAADWPAGFLGGNGTGRMYFDPSLSAQQRPALEAVMSGSRGGMPDDVFKALVPNVLPAQTAAISIQKNGDTTTITIGDYGQAVVTPRRGASGEVTRLMHGAAAIRENVVWGDGRGTAWHDPDLRRWESLGHGEMSEFDWSA